MEAALPFQRRVWTAERVAWTGLALLALAGLLGVLGRGGPFSDAVAVTPDGALRIRYERFQRLKAPAAFRVELGPRPSPTSSGAVEVQLGADVLEGWRVEGMVPQPAATRAVPAGLVLTVPASVGARQVLLVRAVAERFGIVSATIGTSGGRPVQLFVLVWP